MATPCHHASTFVRTFISLEAVTTGYAHALRVWERVFELIVIVDATSELSFSWTNLKLVNEGSNGCDL